MKSISASSSGFVSPPRLACAPRLSISRRKLAVRWLLSSSSPPMQTAASKAWPEAEDDGGKRAVLFNERLRNNSWTAGTGESRSCVSAASRFSCRMMKSVNGWVPRGRRMGIAGEKIFTRASSPQVSAAGFCCARLVIAVTEPVPAGKFRQARRLHEHRGRAQFLFTRQGPALFEQRAGRCDRPVQGHRRPRPADAWAPAGRTASSAKPRMAQIKNHNHRIVSISPEKIPCCRR